MRYDVVLHLTSTAVDKPEVFSNQTNQNRSETVEEASKIDEAIINCYTNHKNHYILANNQKFEEKLDGTGNCKRIVFFFSLKEMRNKTYIQNVQNFFSTPY